MVNVKHVGTSDAYKAYVNQQYSGIKDDDTIESDKKFIKAKKNILANPETPHDTARILRNEINELEADIATKKLKEKYNPTEDTFEFKNKTSKYEEPTNKKSGFGKKAATTVASAVLPGLGQAINGQWGKAAAFAFGAPLATAAACLINPILGIAVGTGAYIANAIDAYKNA